MHAQAIAHAMSAYSAKNVGDTNIKGQHKGWSSQNDTLDSHVPHLDETGSVLTESHQACGSQHMVQAQRIHLSKQSGLVDMISQVAMLDSYSLKEWRDDRLCCAQPLASIPIHNPDWCLG